jgi:molecular chaperone GrpE
MTDTTRSDGTPTNGEEAPAPRPKTRAEERIEAIDTSATALMEQIAELQARAETAEAELESVRTQWQRTAADFANYRRRSEEDRYAGQAAASEALLRKVVAVADDLARSVEHVPPEEQDSPWVEGVIAIERKLLAVLDSEGVSAIESIGRPFDPRFHEAVSMEPTDEATEGTVTRELQRGYQVRDRVLRPALVVVATPAPPTTND